MRVFFLTKLHNEVKPSQNGEMALSFTQKEDQTLAFKTDYRLMQVKSIAGAFCNTFDLH